MINSRSISNRKKSNYAENDLFGDYLYTLVSSNIRIMAGKFYSVIGDDDINDMVQDAWLRVIDKRDQFKPGWNFEGWVFRICQNFIRDTAPLFSRYRKARVMYDYYVQGKTGHSSDKEEICCDADYDIIEREEVARFKKTLKRLSDTDRTIILMARDGYTNSEIAEHLGTTTCNLRLKKHRAYLALERFGFKCR